jgi:hypothetical protein
MTLLNHVRPVLYTTGHIGLRTVEPDGTLGPRIGEPHRPVLSRVRSLRRWKTTSQPSTASPAPVLGTVPRPGGVTAPASWPVPSTGDPNP